MNFLYSALDKGSALLLQFKESSEYCQKIWNKVLFVSSECWNVRRFRQDSGGNTVGGASNWKIKLK